MRYIGGKSKLAGGISKEILSRSVGCSRYLEPFVGGGSMFARIAPHFDESVASDLSEDLALMWDAVFTEGWLPPERVSESEYHDLRDSNPSALRAFVGFGGSFGGKWFGGYARGGVNADGTPRNHQGESSRAVGKIAASVKDSNVTAIRRSYEQCSPEAGDVVYCDPPYASTQEYAATGGFDSERFWETAKQWSLKGALVFVSEYSAPTGWICVWQHEHRVSLKKTTDIGGRYATTEKLFMFDPSISERIAA